MFKADLLLGSFFQKIAGILLYLFNDRLGTKKYTETQTKRQRNRDTGTKTQIQRNRDTDRDTDTEN